MIVCTKETPDTAAAVDVVEGKATWGDAPLVINPWDEYTVQEGINLKEQGASTVTVLALGGEDTREAIKHALAMGCDDAALIADEAFAQVDSLTVAKGLAGGVRQFDDVGLVISGKMTTDANGGALPVQLGRLLGWPTVTYVAKIQSFDVDGKSITVERLVEGGRQIVTAPLPAVISVVKEINEPGYPSFMGIRKAARAQYPTWSAADLGLDADLSAKVDWTNLEKPPVKAGDAEIISAGSVQEAAEQLADKLMEEKVI
ncbi:MAG: electron transfer flavoprotein subunit beta/FixA family protein [Anaerolineae bacterium]